MFSRSTASPMFMINENEYFSTRFPKEQGDFHPKVLFVSVYIQIEDKYNCF